MWGIGVRGLKRVPSGSLQRSTIQETTAAGATSPASRRALASTSKVLKAKDPLLASRGGWPREENKMREIVSLQCPVCKNRNYSTTKNKKTTTGRLEFSKFCNTCRKHTDHKETK